MKILVKMTKNNDRKIYVNDFTDEFSFSKEFHKKNISFNRVAFIFFFFVFVSLIFSVKIFYYGSVSEEKLSQKKISQKNNIRSDIVDVDGNFLAKTVLTNNVGINPKLVNDKKKLLIKLKLLFPELDVDNFNSKFKKKIFFISKKNYLLRNMIKSDCLEKNL